MLDRIGSPADVKALKSEELPQLCGELREYITDHVSVTGGHLSSNLGAVELTVAVHRVFDTSRDRLVFDVGHQSYVHKLLTGRRDRFDTLRTLGGLSGFPDPEESGHDAFIAGHASNSISVALGMARARTLAGEDYDVIALIGDGAMTGGLAYEAMNDAGQSGEKLIIILNDNEMSIARNVGGIASHLARQRLKPGYMRAKNAYRRITKKTAFGRWIYKHTSRMKSRVRRQILASSMFEDMGLQYAGPVSGHDLTRLTEALTWAKEQTEPVLVHVVTKKGKGKQYAEQNPGKYHGVGPFDPVTGAVPPAKQTFSDVFGQTMTELARQDSRVTAITAAMTDGTGLSEFSRLFPERFVDVGIAEEHAVSMAAGMAAGGAKPVVAVYSTFLQRAYDMLMHDVAITGQHVVLAVDRAGLVGADGRTHQGIFDTAFLSTVPGMKIYCPAGFEELRVMLRKAVLEETCPVAVRYPRGGEGAFTDCVTDGAAVLRSGDDCTIVTYGVTVNDALETARRLEQRGKSAEIVKLGLIAPLELESVFASVRKTGCLIVAEEASARFCVGERIAAALEQAGIAARVVLKNLGDGFVPHGSVEQLRRLTGIDPESLEKAVLEALAHE